jgi:hypothetical protein
MTSKEWEKQILDGDRKIKKKIDKYRNKGTRRVILGLIVALFGINSLNDVIQKFTKVATEYTKTTGKNSMSLDVIAGAVRAGAIGTDSKAAMASLALILLAIAVFMWAVMARNKADAIETKMFKWMPDEAEIADIRKRFDNDFVRGVLSKISGSETESVTVALDGIVIDNNDGEVSYNFNREGYRRLTNYESKQLAFFIGSEAFPEGFILHQLKKHATVYDSYARGYAETGEIHVKAPDEEEEIKKNVRWLLKEIYKLTRYKKLKPKEEHEKAVLVEGGHIVLNKGYRENTEKYKAL